MRTKYWVMIFAALLVLFTAAALLIPIVGAGNTANIYRNGECIMSIDLDKVGEGCSFTLEDEDGHINVVEVEHGRIRVASANCPDGVCVDTGWISSGLRPIVCLPARLEIRLERSPKANEPDAVTGYSAYD